jgi:hypothetical protein
MILPSSEIASLDSAVSCWELVEYIAEAFVILGCVGEFVAEFTTWLPKEPIDRRPQCGRLSLLVLIAALAVELTALVGTNILSAKLMALLELQAAQANERAAQANERTEKLRVALADRDLSPEQQRKIGEACVKFTGQTVQLRSYPNDLEAARLIVALKAAFEPRIHVADRTGELTATWGDPDMVLGIHVVPSQRSPGFAQALVTMLRTDGRLTVADLPAYGSGSDTTDILVGMKPVVLAKEAVKGK